MTIFKRGQELYEPRIVSWRTGKASGSSLREIMVEVVDNTRCRRVE